MKIQKEITFKDLITEVIMKSIRLKSNEQLVKDLIDAHCDSSIYKKFFDYVEENARCCGRYENLSREWLIKTIKEEINEVTIFNSIMIDGEHRRIKSIEFDLIFKHVQFADYMGVKFDKVHHIVLNNNDDTPLISIFTNYHAEFGDYNAIIKGLQRNMDLNIWYDMDSPESDVQIKIIPCEYNKDTDEWEQEVSMSMKSGVEFTYKNLQIITTDGTLIKC